MDYNYENQKYLSVPLPEDLLKEKWSGHFDRVRTMLDIKLKDENLPMALRRRLELEFKNLELLEYCYKITEEEALAMMRENIPDFTKEELERLVLEDKADWIYINGERRFLRSFRNTVLKTCPELSERAKMPERDWSVLNSITEGLKDGEEYSCHIHIRHEMFAVPEAVCPGKKVFAHLPLPCERDQIKNLRILNISPAPKAMPGKDDPQPCAYFEEEMREDLKFSAEYAFDHVAVYADLGKADLDKVAEGEIPEDAKAFLKEEPAHIMFTPYLCELAQEIRGEETNPLLIARRIYDFITTKINYMFLREYASIDNISEYCALKRKGDCGMQALLFITLCRICGVPAKWQSGIDSKPESVGQHDWAMFYVPSKGWVCSDLSFGGSAYRSGNMKLWNYFFGNADPFRIPLNNEFERDLVPAKKFMRIDPYDNQCGEMEYEDRGLRDWERDYNYFDLGIHANPRG